jgi:hypothetical protein
MRSRIGMVAALAIGVAMVVGTVAISLPSKTAGAERLTDSIRPAFTASAVAQSRTDLEQIKAMAGGLQREVAPTLSHRLGMTPAQFNAFLGHNFPAVAKGVGQLDGIVPRFDGIVNGLEQQQGNFAKADAVPVSKPIDLPATTVPWVFFLCGGLVALVALAGLLWPARWSTTSLVTACVVGAGLIIAPLALDLNGKAKAVDSLTDAFRPAFSQPGSQQIRTDMNTVQAMADQLQTDLLPAVAGRLKVTPAQLTENLSQISPAFAAGVAGLPQSLPRFQALVRDIEANGGNFRAADAIPVASTKATTLLWLFLVPGVILLLVGGVPLLAARARRRTAASPRTAEAPVRAA